MKFVSRGFKSIALALPNQWLIRLFHISFTLLLCYKPLSILQKLTKSQKVHISKDNGLPNFTISTLLKIGSGFPRVEILNLSSNRSFILWMQSIHHINICRKPLFPMNVFSTDISWSVNFLVHTCDIKNKQIYYYLLLKEAVKLYQLSTSFQVSFEVCLKEFQK